MMKLTTLICPDSDCGAENERNADICRGCGSALGFVNVNLLSDPYFQEGLEERYRSVTANLPGAEVAWLEEVVTGQGRAVINMPGRLLYLLVNENKDYISYQRGVEQGKLAKKSFAEDRIRCIVESAFYGFDGRNFVYAALSLDDNGVATYGDVSVVLKTKNIEKRTTVFEKDTLVLFGELVSGGWKADELIPSGHCGTWYERAKMVAIKHGSQMDANHRIADLAALILRSDGNGTNDEFIELHIFNTVNPVNFERVVFQNKSLKSFDRVQFKILKTKLSDLSIEVVER